MVNLKLRGILYVLTSLILGLGSWIIPFIKHGNKDGKIILSFTLCLLSIFVQILMMKNYGDEWTLIVDALGALKTVIPVLIIGTVVVNLPGNRKSTVL